MNEYPELELIKEMDNVLAHYIDLGENAVDSLMHYGVKGMKWGKRKKRSIFSKLTSDMKKGAKLQRRADKNMDHARKNHGYVNGSRPGVRTINDFKVHLEEQGVDTSRLSKGALSAGFIRQKMKDKQRRKNYLRGLSRKSS